MTVQQDPPFPRLALVAGAGLVALSLALAAAGSYGGVGRTALPEAETVQVRELRFSDRPDGGIDVREDARVIATVAPASNGFLRGVLRSLARERRLAGLGAQAPFRLLRFADGRLALEDAATGRRIALEVFGPDNYRVFASLLTAGGTDIAGVTARATREESAR